MSITASHISSKTTHEDTVTDTPTHPPPHTYHLIGEQQHRLEAEAAIAKVEQVLQRRSEQVEHHHIVVALAAKPRDVRNADRRRGACDWRGDWKAIGRRLEGDRRANIERGERIVQ
jgi:hypothetical protein